MRKVKMFLSFFLSLSIIITSFTGTTSVSANNMVSTAVSDFDYKRTYTAFEAPDIIDKEEVQNQKYVDRIYEEEKDLYTFVFANEGGSHTMRVFDHPVKYIDEDGNIRDISLSIKRNEDGKLVSDNHMVDVLFNSDLKEGINLKYQNIDITMKTKAECSKAKLSDDSRKINYDQDEKTSYVYSLTYVGFKEDIVVNEYTGQTEYEFEINTNGLHPVRKDDSVFLADQEGNIKASIGDIIVFTADERNNTFGTLEYETLQKDQKYKFTIKLDEDYLKDEKTVYPITIDPTIEINYDNDGAGAIEDVTINSLGYSDGSSGSLFVGKRASFGIARTLMRFPTLDLSTIASSANITSAHVELRDIMCESDSMNVNCYVFTGNTWTESTAGWSTINPNSYTALQSTNTVSYSNGISLSTPHRYSFSITGAVRGWRSGSYNQSKGIIFKADASVESASTNISKTFASYNRATNKPSLTVNYTESSFDTAATISLNTTYTFTSVESGKKGYYKFVPTSTGFYTFESSSIVSGDPFAWLHNVYKTQLYTNNDGGNGYNFRITYHLVEGVKYYFVAGFNNSGVGSYSFTLNATTASSLMNGYASTIIDNVSVTANVAYKNQCYKVVSGGTKDFLFFSSDRNGDPKVWMYDSSLSLIGTNDNGAGDNNFRLVESLTSGQTYYIVCGHNSNSSGNYTMNLYYDPNYLSNDQYIKNVQSSHIISIEGPSAQTWVNQLSFNMNNESRWQIQKQSDGYYNIKSLYGSCKYIGIYSTSTGEDNIKLYSSTGTNTSWSIFRNKNNEIIFLPQSAGSKILMVPATTSGTRLQLKNLYEINNYSKWRCSYYSAFMNRKVPTLTFNLQRIGSEAGSTTWLPLINSSVSAWNNAGVGTNISMVTTSSPFSISVEYSDEDWYGETRYSYSGDSIITAVITINSRTLESKSDSFRRSTIAHEIGHLLGLDDNPPVHYYNDSLMSHYRDRSIIYIPQEYDCNNILFQY